LAAVNNPVLRASDADRQRVISALERHTAAGLLTLDEFGDRVAIVLQAVTHLELSAVTADLPADPGLADEEAAARPAHARQLAIAFALAMVTLIVLGVILALGR
jgi:hypothetical protein